MRELEKFNTNTTKQLVPILDEHFSNYIAITERPSLSMALLEYNESVFPLLIMNLIASQSHKIASLCKEDVTQADVMERLNDTLKAIKRIMEDDTLTLAKVSIG